MVIALIATRIAKRIAVSPVHLALYEGVDSMKQYRSYACGRVVALAASLAVAISVMPTMFLSSHAATTSASHGAAEAADIEALRDLKLRLWPKAYREQDTALLDRILDDSFGMIDGSGAISTKSEEVAWIKDNKPGYDRFRYEIERIDVYDGRSAVVSGLGTIEFDEKGGVRTVRYRSTNVLIKRDGRWRAVASHVSMLKETPSP
jgi:ketosteroid isomerase-like protein